MIGWRSRISLLSLRVVCNPNDSMSVRRIINVPSRGIGATTRLTGSSILLTRQGISLFEAIQRVGEITAINPRPADESANASPKFLMISMHLCYPLMRLTMC